MDQWVERLSAFLNMKTTVIGQIGGGRNRPNGLLDVALMQSLVRKGDVATHLLRRGSSVWEKSQFRLRRVECSGASMRSSASASSASLTLLDPPVRSSGNSEVSSHSAQSHAIRADIPIISL